MADVAVSLPGDVPGPTDRVASGSVTIFCRPVVRQGPLLPSTAHRTGTELGGGRGEATEIDLLAPDTESEKEVSARFPVPFRLKKSSSSSYGTDEVGMASWAAFCSDGIPFLPRFDWAFVCRRRRRSLSFRYSDCAHADVSPGRSRDGFDGWDGMHCCLL